MGNLEPAYPEAPGSKITKEKASTQTKMRYNQEKAKNKHTKQQKSKKTVETPKNDKKT